MFRCDQVRQSLKPKTDMIWLNLKIFIKNK